MNNYTTTKNRELSTAEIGKIIAAFQVNELPIFQKRFDYYDGKHPILRKVASDSTKPCNRIVCNFVENIVDTYEGYALGIPTTYEGAQIDELHDIFNYNDINDEDAEFFRNGLIFGRSAEICYIDEDGKQRFRTLDTREIIPVYDDTLNQDLLYVIRFWKDKLVENNTETYTVQVYSSSTVKTYRSYVGFSAFELLSEEPHYFSQVPITIFKLNAEEKGIADIIFSLQDAYNALISDSIDDWDNFCDAYLVLKGVIADSEDLRAMKETRTLLLDNDAEADYLIKNTSTTEIEHLLQTVEAKIRELSACPNFNNETFGTSSGIAIRYRMMAMENQTASILSNFKKALQRRIELLSDILRIVSGEAVWRDVTIRFTRNIPTDLTDTVAVVNQLRGVVSDETLLSLLPFVEDVPAEIERIKKQTEENMALYSFAKEVEEDE